MNKIYFLHIPKTGGSTFSDYLASQFDVGSIQPWQTWNHLLHRVKRRALILPGKLLSDHPCVRGHYGLSALRESDTNIGIVTILRDPVERVVSQYSHIVRDPMYNNWVNRSFYEFKDMGLDSILDDPERNYIFTNTQTRYVSVNLPIKRLAFRDYRMSREYMYYDSIKEFRNPPMSETKLLRTAKRTLDRCVVVGLQEFLPESMALTADRFEFGLNEDQKRLLEARNKYEPSESEISKIKKLNKLDYEVFEYAKDRLFKDYEDLCGRKLNQKVSLNSIDDKERNEILKELRKNWQ